VDFFTIVYVLEASPNA